jgi:DNA-binding transcriptional MocR family regulator
VSQPKYRQVATRIRVQIAAGMLMPGQAAPSGDALARATGYSPLTCRKGLRVLIREGVLIPGASPGARPRVPLRAPAVGEQDLARAARALSASLASRRRAAGLTQPKLAAITGMSVTSVGHAETGRLWQSRQFWERADEGVRAGGELLALYDAYRAAAATADPAAPPEDAGGEATSGIPPAVAIAASALVASVTITWVDGTATTVYPPKAPARPADATPVY